MTDALAKEPFVALFAALNVELPLRLHDEDVGVVLDADKQDVFVVDVNAVRANEHATNIAHLIVETVNTAGGFPSASPLARASIAGQDPAAVQNPKPPARTAAGEFISQQVGDPALLEELEVREGDLVMLRRAIEEGDPKAELLVRVNDMLRETRAAIAKVEGR